MMKSILLAMSIILVHVAYSQCTITSEVKANGTVNKTTTPEVIYYTGKATIYSSVVYDGIDYYFDLIVRPITDKKNVSKTITMQLANATVLNLDLYDSYTTDKDTALNILFRISKEQLQQLRAHDLDQLTLKVDDEDKHYKFVKHKDMLRIQLNCMIEDKKKEK